MDSEIESILYVGREVSGISQFAIAVRFLHLRSISLQDTAIEGQCWSSRWRMG